MTDWPRLLEDARALAASARTEPSRGALAVMAGSVAKRLEDAIADAGEGLGLLGGDRPRAVIILRDKAGGRIDVAMGFDPPLELDDAPPRCYDAAISFLSWLRKEATAGGG